MPTIEEIKARLEGLNRRSNKPKDLWKPKGSHELRLLDNPHTADPFLQLYFHYDVGEVINCPKMNFGEECAVCDACEALRSWKDAHGAEKAESVRKEDWEMFKKIQAKARVFVAMIERGKEADGARYWSITPNQAGEILAFATDTDRIAACEAEKNPLRVLVGTEKAYDLTVTFLAKGTKDNPKSFDTVKIGCKIAITPLSKDKGKTKEILSTVKDIKEVYPPMTSAQVSKIWASFIGQNSPEAKPTGGTEKYAASTEEAKPNTRENAKNVGTRNLDDAFGDLLNAADSK